jgi:hypothetical protein
LRLALLTGAGPNTYCRSIDVPVDRGVADVSLPKPHCLLMTRV